jgi:hypothetical protein
MAQVPAQIDRATFERVLKRAAELQAASRDAGQGLSEEEILALGTEVGIPVEHLRQALLEERTRPAPPAPAGTFDRWFGAAQISAERVVQGTDDRIIAAITKWLEFHEHFVVQRTTPGRATYEPMNSFVGAMRRIGAVFDGSRAQPYLDKVDLVTAIVTPLETGFCHVTLAASLTRARNQRLTAGGLVGAIGPLAGAAMVIVGSVPLAPLLPLAVFGAAGWFVARGFRPAAARAQLGLERALDELERTPALPPGTPPAPAGGRTVGQLVRELGREVRKAIEP